jgi:hypothetical protein
MRWQIAQLAFSRNGDAAVSADFWGVNELHGEDRPKRKCRGLATSLRHFRPVLSPQTRSSQVEPPTVCSSTGRWRQPTFPLTGRPFRRVIRKFSSFASSGPIPLHKPSLF